jgi:hypothetical protein
MSQIDENQIHDRLKRLSQLEPGQEATDRTMQKVRAALIADEESRVRLAPPSWISGLIKLAAAAVIMIGAGYIGGRLSAPEPLDMQEFQAALETSIKSSLEPTIRQQLHNEFENRLQSALAAERNMLKQELAQQVHRDMDTYAEQTLTTVGNLMDQRLMNFARMIEAARIKERQRVAAAFDYMGSRFGDGLVTLATRTDNLLDAERTGPTADVSEN